MKLVLRSLVLVVLVVAGGLVWLWSSGSEASSAAARPEVGARAQSSAASGEQRAPDSPQVGDATERAATEVDAPEAVAATTTATIRVSLVAAESQVPLAGRRVWATPEPAPKSWAVRSGDGTRAAPRESALSDSAGRVELEVEAGKAHRVSDSEASYNDSVVIGALEAGATVEIVLRIRVDADASFFGRVVDARTRQPIASARFQADDERRRASSASRSEQVEPNGEFELRYRSGADRFVRVEAEGYTWTVAPLKKEHATRLSALVIPLVRSATLEVLVLDGARPLANAKVRVTTDSYRMSVSIGIGDLSFGEDPQWTGASGADGVARVVDLAPNVPLTLSVLHERRKKSLGEPLTLEPSEVRRVEIRLGGGATIRGRVETSSGAPLADVEMWRIVAERRSRTMLAGYADVVATARSDASGQFTFEDVAEGVWSIGVAPSESERRRAQPAKPHQLAPVAEPVVVTGSEAVIDVIVRTDEGLFLSGRTLDASGSAASCRVVASSSDSTVFVFESSQANGTFRLGPLPAGEFRVQASAMPGQGNATTDSASDEVRALAGASDLELRLLPGASLSVSLIGPDGAAIDGVVWLEASAPKSRAWIASTRDGKGRFDGLAPGTYFLSASTSSGLFASRSGIVASTNAETDEIALRLERGSILELKYDGPEPVESYDVFVDGQRIASNGVEKGAITRFVAPAGAVEVRKFVRNGDAPEVHRLTLSPGETRQVTVGQ